MNNKECKYILPVSKTLTQLWLIRLIGCDLERRAAPAHVRSNSGQRWISEHKPDLEMFSYQQDEGFRETPKNEQKSGYEDNSEWRKQMQTSALHSRYVGLGKWSSVNSLRMWQQCHFIKSWSAGVIVENQLPLISSVNTITRNNFEYRLSWLHTVLTEISM